MLITLHSEEIYIAVVPWLIRDKSCIEASFLKCLKDPPYMWELLCRGGICRRENDRDALVRSIRLRQHVSERDKSLTTHRIQMGSCLPRIAIETPAMRTRGLPKD